MGSHKSRSRLFSCEADAVPLHVVMGSRSRPLRTKPSWKVVEATTKVVDADRHTSHCARLVFGHQRQGIFDQISVYKDSFIWPLRFRSRLRKLLCEPPHNVGAITSWVGSLAQPVGSTQSSRKSQASRSRASQ